MWSLMALRWYVRIHMLHNFGADDALATVALVGYILALRSEKSSLTAAASRIWVLYMRACRGVPINL
jgi:hypothetical protein